MSRQPLPPLIAAACGVIALVATGYVATTKGSVTADEPFATPQPSVSHASVPASSTQPTSTPSTPATALPSATPTLPASAASSSEPTPAVSATPTAMARPTAMTSATSTPTVAPEITPTSEPSASSTPRPAPTHTHSPSPTRTPVPAPTKTRTPTPTPTRIADPTPTSNPSRTPAPVPTPTPTQSSPPTPTPTPTPTRTTTPGKVSGTFTGPTIYFWVPGSQNSVTVTVTLSNSVITNASASYSAPTRFSMYLMGQAVPILNSETVSANSAQIASVGGASLVSTAYCTSLQDALLKSGR